MNFQLKCPVCEYDFEAPISWFFNNKRICCMNCSKAWSPAFDYSQLKELERAALEKKLTKVEEPKPVTEKKKDDINRDGFWDDMVKEIIADDDDYYSF